MLGLTLRDEFRGKRLKGTAIELSNEANTGATQIAAKQFLEITYPTHDLLKGIEAVGSNQGRPVVVIGERGLGKSHLMAAPWRCAAPHSGEVVDFGRILWGEAHEYPQEIILRSGAKSAGLFDLRIT